MVKWLGYEFEIYYHDGNWNEVAGLYIFAGERLDQQGTPQWRAFYVGQTQSFGKRLPTHENWPGAALLGATHVHALVEPEAKKRALIEKALIDSYHPPLNVQLK